MKNKAQGFTLIEILFTFFIIILLLSLSSVDFSAFFNRQMTNSLGTTLFHAIQFARSESIKRNSIVSLCGSVDLKYCSDDWTSGYIVFVEKSQEILRQEQFYRPMPIQSNIQMIRFSGNGHSLTRGTITIQQTPQKSYKIVIYDSGRVRIT